MRFDPSDAIVVVGATGAVGREALSILARAGASPHSVRAVASERSVGRDVPFGAARIQVRALNDAVFGGAALALFAADAETARRWAPVALSAGARVVDNSSAFRMDPATPLVIPEVNGESIGTARLVANPNCSTILLLMALDRLRRAFGVRSVTVSTYQAVSGAGLDAIGELRAHTRAALAGRTLPSVVFRQTCAFNVFNHESPVDASDGLNIEERKMINESRRIWDDVDLPISPTCVRVPVVRAHSQSVSVTLASPATEKEVREQFRAAPGIEIIDDRESGRFPTPLCASGTDPVFIGRIRPDPGAPIDASGRTNRFQLFACMDQLRKGAALNALQIGERLLSRDTHSLYIPPAHPPHTDNSAARSEPLITPSKFAS